MTDEDVQYVKNQDGQYGIYRPDEHVIETYIGDDRHKVPGEYLGVNWHPAEQDELIESIEDDIAEVRAGLEDLRGEDLTGEQEQELNRLERRIRSYVKVLGIFQEADEEADDAV